MAATAVEEGEEEDIFYNQIYNLIINRINSFGAINNYLMKVQAWPLIRYCPGINIPVLYILEET